MPLRCHDPIAGSSIHAFDLSPEAWQALGIENRSKRHLRMPCCSSQVVLKRSRRGTQFFAHKAVGACTTAPETEAHLRLKRLAVEAARANGWQAETEVLGYAPSGEQWKADVLAVRGDHKVAIEVQWSAQTDEEMVRRQERYAQSGVRCLWLLRRSALPVDRALPVAGIAGDPNEGFFAVVRTGAGEQRVAMDEFLAAAFSKRLRFGMPVGASAQVSIWTGRIFCRSCGAETQIVTGIVFEFGPHQSRFSIPELDDHPGLFETISGHVPKATEIGAFKRRFSKTQERRYLSNRCAHCDAIVGQFFEYEAMMDEEVAVRFAIRITDAWRTAILLERDGHRPGWGVYPRD